MRTLVVVAHPDPRSLTHEVARLIAVGIETAGPSHSSQIADLAAEGFDPVFSHADRVVYRTKSSTPEDVAREQARIACVDALVLVFPIFWWSMPALLKGWIDRVFVNGWAFDYDPSMRIVKKLEHLTIHTVGTAASDAGTYHRHGYLAAMQTQLSHGVIDYCGARRGLFHLIHEAEKVVPDAGQIARIAAAIASNSKAEAISV